MSHDGKKTWKPTLFMNLLIEYENSLSDTDKTDKLDKINKILNSEECDPHLFGTDNHGFNSIIISIREKYKIIKLLISKIRKIDLDRLFNILYYAVWYNNYDIVRFIMDKYNTCRFVHSQRTDLIMLCFATGNVEMINHFLDLHGEYNIFAQSRGKQNVYELIYQDLSPEKLEIALETLMKHRYYGPILLSKLYHDIKTFTNILPDLVKEKKIDRDRIILYPVSDEHINIHKTTDNIVYFRENCLSEIGQRSPEILYSPESMAACKAKYHSMFYQKYEKDRLSDLEKKECWKIVSQNTKFCDYYSILTPDHIDKIME